MAIRIVRKERQEKYIDHNSLINRDIANQHPIAAITGLQEYLDGVYNDISTIGDTIASNLVIGGNANVPYIIQETDWLYSDEQKIYYHIIAHTMQSEDVTLNFYNELKHNIDIEVDYEILNDSSIAIYIESPRYVKAILNGYLNINLAGLKTIKTTDFLDDANVTSNKAWSSYQLMKTLAGYVTKSDMYTKTQMTSLFSLKAFEHGHENKDVLDGFSLNDSGALLFNGEPVLRNIEPVIKTLTWDNQTNDILNLVLDTANVYSDIKGIFISGSEFIVRNEGTKNLILKVTDGNLDVLNVEVDPGDTQKYILGTSSNIKLYIQGIYSAQYTVEALSEIDNLHLDVPIIDDYSKKDTTTYSSNKITQEISNAVTGITLQSLGDVVIPEKKDNVVLAYSKLTDKFVAVDASTLSISGGTGTNEIRQINVSNANGTSSDPVVIEIPIDSIDFKFPKVNILKFMPAVDNALKVANSFDITDKSQFISPDYVKIDNGISFITCYEYEPSVKKPYSNYVLTAYDVDLTNFKDVEAIEFSYDDNAIVDDTIKIDSIPNDTLIVQQIDIDLSYVENIDYLRLVGEGTNIRVVVSANSGESWKTFNGGSWVDVELNVDNVKLNGMSLETFNLVVNSTAWNELLNNSIRLAYLISQDGLTDVESLTRLEIQYDSFGSWLQAKDSEYDVMYVSNSLMKVLVYVSGDIKINF